MIIDTHIHLDSNRYETDLDEIIHTAIQEGVGQFIIPGADPDDLKRAVELSQKYDSIFFSVGAHPYHHHQYNEELFIKYITHPKCVAVGECGLDYFRLPEGIESIQEEKESQKKVFISHINLAIKYNKPLIVHIRDASLDSKDILINNSAKKVGGVLHCFNANEQLLHLSKYNFYFGIGGVLTFKNAKKLVDILPKIPLEKLLIETDGPYLTPHPHRGERNEPKYTLLVAQKIGEILNIDINKVQDITTENAKRLFKSL